MKSVFFHKKITGMLGVLPEKESFFDDEVANYCFPEKQTMRLKKIMGYNKHRLVKNTTATSDLCLFGLNFLLDRKLISQEDIGAIIVVTSTPDFLMPPVSNIIHGEGNFSNDVICLDINQGCTGFLMGLMQSFLVLEKLNKKVILFNVDTLSKKVSSKDRNSFPLIGDACTISLIENNSCSGKIFFNIYNDGKRREALIIPAGGSRLPCSTETSILRDLDNDGNFRCLDNLKMSGSDVFTFVQTDIPPMLSETLLFAGISQDSIDYFLFHQPNKFMLKKLAEKMQIPQEKMPMNIVEEFGNPSGASIPVNIIRNVGHEVVKKRFKCCFSAFGSGLSWGAMILDFGDLEFCEMVVSNL